MKALNKQKFIYNCHSGLSFYELMNMYSYTRYELLHILELYKNEILSEIYQKLLEPNLTAYKIGNCEKVLIVSDTHLASIYENIGYIESVYEYAIQNQISYIIHGGDFLDGLVEPKYSIGTTYYHQLEYAAEIYPKHNSIQNLVLYGNHDYRLYQSHIPIGQELEWRRNDLYDLGFAKAYIEINGYRFLFQHPYPKYRFIFPYRIPSLVFEGHGHILKLDCSKRNIKIPTLSDSNPGRKEVSTDQKPGFLELTFEKQKKELKVKALHIKPTIHEYKSASYHL